MYLVEGPTVEPDSLGATGSVREVNGAAEVMITGWEAGAETRGVSSGICDTATGTPRRHQGKEHQQMCSDVRPPSINLWPDPSLN